jgi:hypothetical protein
VPSRTATRTWSSESCGTSSPNKSSSGRSWFNRFIERHIVNYIKYLIKHPKLKPQAKFNALLLLKELAKTNVPTIVNYIAQKILKRLAIMARSNPAQCLNEFTDDADPIWATQFHYLDLETLGIWAEMFAGKNSPYMANAKMLKAAGLLPVKEKYWNFPSSTEKEQINAQYAPAGRLISSMAFDDAKCPEGSRENPAAGQF